MFWIFFTVIMLAVLGWCAMYVLACMMGMPDCVLN
jgi:hypothetical protein